MRLSITDEVHGTTSNLGSVPHKMLFFIVHTFVEGLARNFAIVEIGGVYISEGVNKCDLVQPNFSH